MTIKRRLFLSNIAMIAFPIILTILMVTIIAMTFFGISGIDPYSIRQGMVSDEIKAELIPFNSGRFIPSIMLLVILIIVVYLTNRALTRYIFKSIMSPINTLTDGVHQIRDGNLTYRIEYKNSDEFAPVCDDFNEMAMRLSDMVEQKQKDEQNRRELIAGISHDLRTPLTAIKAYIEGIEKGVADTEEKRTKYLRTIKQKAADLEYIINQLFLFSKLDIGEFPIRLEQINIGDELSLIIRSTAEEYGENGLAVSLAESTTDVFCNIDVVLFGNVLHNILENSVKYKNKDIVCAEIACRSISDNVVISITDDGPGVTEATLSRLFEVFYRGDAARQNPHTGSGLGLAITTKIMERMNGKISAENVPSGGLKIVLTLPISERSGKR